jgi:hypothetical protein
MIRENLKTFFDLAAERYRIHLNRNEFRLSAPWTKDPIYQKYRFCNVFREDDKTTAWFRDTLREPLRNDAARVLFATVAFRWFNRVSTGKLISAMLWEGPAKWDPEKVRTASSRTSQAGGDRGVHHQDPERHEQAGRRPVVHRTGPQGRRRTCRSHLPHTPANERELEWEAVLTEFPYLGDFMSYEVVTDLRYTTWLDRAKDIDSWCNPGPGCTRGLGWVVSGNFDQFNRGSRKDRAEMLPLMQEILLASRSDEYWPRQFCRSWDMRTVEHWLCETTKYIRVRDGGSPPKERFKS